MNRSNLESMNLTSSQMLFALVFAILPSALKIGVLRSKGAKIGRNVSIGFGTVILASDFSKVRIGKFTRIGQFTIIACGSIDIGRYVRVQMFTWIWGAGKLILKDKALIGARVRIDLRNNNFQCGVASGVATGVIIYTHTQIFPYSQGWIHRRKDVVMEDYVRVGINSLLMPGVTIGRYTFVGAGSVVIEDLPPNSFAAGNPAKVISSIDRFKEKVDDKEFRRRVEEIALDMIDYFGYKLISKKRSDGGYLVEFGFPKTFSAERWTLIVADPMSSDTSKFLARFDGKKTILFSLSEVPEKIRSSLPLWYNIKDHRCNDLSTEFAIEIWNFLYETWEEVCEVEETGKTSSGKTRN